MLHYRWDFVQSIPGEWIESPEEESINAKRKHMQIQINTDKNIEGSARMAAYFTETLQESFNRFDEHITRLEVHLSDVNGSKEGGDDKRCLLEARVKGLKPFVVTHHAENLDIAVSGAVDKLMKTLDSALGKLRSY